MTKHRIFFASALCGGLLLCACLSSAFAAESILEGGGELELGLYRGASETFTVRTENSGVYRLYTSGTADTQCYLDTGGTDLLYNDDSEQEEEVPNCSLVFLGQAGGEYSCQMELTDYQQTGYEISDYETTTVHLEALDFEDLTAGNTVRTPVDGLAEGFQVRYDQYYCFTPESTGNYTFTLSVSASDCTEEVDVYDSHMNLLVQGIHLYENDERTGTNTFSVSLNAGETYLILAKEWISAAGNVLLSATVTRDAEEPVEPAGSDEPSTEPSAEPSTDPGTEPDTDPTAEPEPSPTPSHSKIDVIIPSEDDPSTEPEWENPFTDVAEGKWYYTSVRYCAIRGLFRGVTETTFEPNTAMTRAMLVQVLYSMSGAKDYPASFVFDDVLPKAWYAPAVSWAYANAVVKGMGDRVFAPNDSITREQMVQILYSYYKNYLCKTPAGADDITGYADWERTGGWAREAMSWAVGNGLIQGSAQTDGSVLLEPKSSATRAQVAAVMERFDGIVY